MKKSNKNEPNAQSKLLISLWLQEKTDKVMLSSEDCTSICSRT